MLKRRYESGVLHSLPHHIMKTDSLEKRISAYITSRQLLDKSRLQLVALSGGADSVALLRILHALGYTLEAIHCNFQLRGHEADRDEAFCQSLCDHLGIVLHRAHFDTRAYAQLHGVSIEMAARTLRYSYFHQLREALGAEAICVAHHRDDNVETILLNLVRGTGVHGLTGMKAQNGAVVRPLLATSRAELVDYLEQMGQQYVTDSTNLVPDVKRNIVRLQVLPLLEQLNPALRDTLLTMASEMEEVSAIVDEHLTHYGETTELAVDVLQQAHAPELILYYFLQPRGFSAAQIRQIATHLDGISGRQWFSPTHELLADRDYLRVFAREDDTPRPMRLPETGRYNFANELTLRVSRQVRNDGFVIPTDPNVAAIDAEGIHFPLIIRRTKQGDRFSPLGLKGGKLVSDFLTNQKKNLWEKRHQVVVCDANDRILWLVGNRISHDVRITDETKQVLWLEKLS